MLQILDFISMEEARTNVSVDYHERGFRKIAWAFLKVPALILLYSPLPLVYLFGYFVC